MSGGVRRVSRRPSVVLLGPAAAGKSTVGELLAGRTASGFVDLDEVADPYYLEVGWSIDRLVRRIGEVGRLAAEREWEPARAHAVERVVEDHPGSVLALGAGHASYTRPELVERVRSALVGVPHVVLLLPSPDRDVTLDALRQRSEQTKGTGWIVDGHDLLAEWVDDQGMRSLATGTVFTDGQTPDETTDVLARMLHGPDHG